MMARCIKALRKLFGPSALKTPHPPVFFPLVAEAWRSIGTNRVRAFLAMLGIIIGVGSVVVMVAIGQGSQQRVEKAINALGNNLLIIIGGNAPKQGMRDNFQPAVFTEYDLASIAQLPAVEAVAYSTVETPQKMSSANATMPTSTTGIIPEYLPIRNWVLEDGNGFTPEDMRLGSRVIILGATVAKKLFPNQSAVGHSVSVGDSKLGFLVVGVLESKGVGLDGKDQDNTTFIPASSFKTYLNIYANSPIASIFVKVAKGKKMDDVSDDINDMLRDIHKIPVDMASNFQVYNLVAIMKVASDSTQAFSLLLGAIASISLVVGSIGIMNIMLVTVSERTREIGIRKAIGATQRQILTQFMLEAIMVSAIGSVIGLGAGIGSGLAAQKWLDIPVAYSAWSVVMALVTAVVVGIASGLYPAFKAARMQVIEALRAVVA